MNFQIFIVHKVRWISRFYLIPWGRSVKDILTCFKVAHGTSGFGMFLEG